MRALLVLALLGGIGYGGYYAYERWSPRPQPAVTAPPVINVPAVQAKREPTVVEQCRDDCEQRAIVYHHPEAVLRLCRASCDAQMPRRPYEPIRSVTRAPADHRPSPIIVPSTAK